jgi:hypothetical protein
LSANRTERLGERRAAVVELERTLGLYRDLCRDSVRHRHERLAKRHNYILGYTVTKLDLRPRRAGARAATKRSAHRKKPPRRRMVGMSPSGDGCATSAGAVAKKHAAQQAC